MHSVVLAVPACGIQPVTSVPAAPKVGRFERLPKWLNCIPLVMQWILLGMRYGGVSVPSCANPRITCGGLVGEGKLEYFDSMGPLAKSYTADYASIKISDHTRTQHIESLMRAHEFSYPVMLKPNLGWCGYGVRLIHDRRQMTDYINAFPKGEILILQRYLTHEGEAGLFYARHPDDPKGKITGITLRYFPQVVGDGVRTIHQLIMAEPRLHRLMGNRLHRPDFDLKAIPAAGKHVRLSIIGSTRIGGLYCDGSNHATAALEKIIDEIARDMQDFHMGRFDVRYENLGELEQGKFIIMEVNGSGSEAIHAWDPKYSIRESYGIIFAKQRLLFRISHANRKKGHKPAGLWAMARHHFHQQKLIERYPLSN